MLGPFFFPHACRARTSRCSSTLCEKKRSQFARTSPRSALTTFAAPHSVRDAPSTERPRLMALRSAAASAAVNREAGRRRNRLGAFLLPRVQALLTRSLPASVLVAEARAARTVAGRDRRRLVREEDAMSAHLVPPRDQAERDRAVEPSVHARAPVTSERSRRRRQHLRAVRADESVLPDGSSSRIPTHGDQVRVSMARGLVRNLR